MGRIRTLKQEFFLSPTIAKVPFRTQITAAGLICCVADDDGRLRDDVKLIRAAIWAQRDDDVTAADVAEDLTILNTVECTDGLPWIVRYEKKQMRIIWIRSFKEHQRISHPTKSKLPPPPRISRNLASPPEDNGLFPPEVEVDLIRRGSGSGSGTRARKTARRSGVNGRVSHEDPNPESNGKAAFEDAMRELAEKKAIP